MTYQGLTYISGADPPFVHQYSHAWFDFRAKSDAYANYFQNSVTATEAHRRFCMGLSKQFTDYSGDLCGIAALMAENQRSGFVWQTFMSNPEVAAAMTLAGFH